MELLTTDLHKLFSVECWLGEWWAEVSSSPVPSEPSSHVISVPLKSLERWAVGFCVGSASHHPPSQDGGKCPKDNQKITSKASSCGLVNSKSDRIYWRLIDASPQRRETWDFFSVMRKRKNFLKNLKLFDCQEFTSDGKIFWGTKKLHGMCCTYFSTRQCPARPCPWWDLHKDLHRICSSFYPPSSKCSKHKIWKGSDCTGALRRSPSHPAVLWCALQCKYSPERHFNKALY